MYATAVIEIGGLVVVNLIVFWFNGRVNSQTIPTVAEVQNSRFERPQGQTWLWISNRCSSVSYLKRASTFLAWDLVDPQHLVASYWVSPACVLALRFCMLLHLAAAIVVDGVLDKTIDAQWPLGFCNWSSIMTGWTGVVGCLVSTKHWTSHALQSSSPRTTLSATNHLKRHQSDVCCDVNTLDMPASLDIAVPTNMACHWGVLERLFLLSLIVAAPAAVLVPALYWPYTYVSTQAYVLQSSAIALLLLEVMLSRAPFISYHWQVWLLFCSAYVAVMWIHAAVTDKWICARLDWSNASSILLYISLLLLIIVMWFAW
ncbi:TPA: hypothetical protein ACH3X2_001709 [Trebouxia sp. C0005]